MAAPAEKQLSPEGDDTPIIFCMLSAYLARSYTRCPKTARGTDGASLDCGGAMRCSGRTCLEIDSDCARGLRPPTSTVVWIPWVLVAQVFAVFEQFGKCF
jgi:hypothetical protein